MDASIWLHDEPYWNYGSNNGDTAFNSRSRPCGVHTIGDAQETHLKISWLMVRLTCGPFPYVSENRKPERSVLRLGEVTPLAMALLLYSGAFWIASARSDLPVHVAGASIVLAGALVAASVVDHRSHRLPNALPLLIAAGGLAFAILFQPEVLLDRTLALFAGVAGLGAVIALYRHVRGRDGMGWGDAKLLGACGAWVGLAGLLTVVLWACLTGLALALALHFAGKRMSRTTRIPFGPHLAFGTWLVWLFGPLV